MQRSRVVVPWREGLILRRAVNLAQVGLRYRSALRLKGNQGIADLRSVLSILALGATRGTALEVEARGDDERDAIQAVHQVFSPRPAFDAPRPERSRRMRRAPQ